MEGLPEPLLAEIIKRITRTSDLNALSLVSKQLYNAEAEERVTIRVGCGLHPETKALSSLCFRFPNLWKVEINYSGWTSVQAQGKQLDNQGLSELSSHCSSLTDLSCLFVWLWPVVNDRRFSAGTVFFSHTKSASSIFS